MIVAVVDTVDEAIELANCSDYSLMAGLWTRDIYNAFKVSEKMRSGKTPRQNTEIAAKTHIFQGTRTLTGPLFSTNG